MSEEERAVIEELISELQDTRDSLWRMYNLGDLDVETFEEELELTNDAINELYASL